MRERAILIVSFGTSYTDTMEKTIFSIENRITEEFSQCDVFRAFTSSIIVKKLKDDGFYVDSVAEAIENIISLGYKECYIQPTHIIAGMEYEKLVEEAEKYTGSFEVMKIGKPMLYATKDLRNIVNILTQSTGCAHDEAVVLMGHGSEHFANTTYAALDYMFKEMGYENFFVGTVEAYPDLETVIKIIKREGYKKASIMPLLIVAGDHALNDMSSDEETSWVNRFISEGIEAKAVVKGLGEYTGVADMYIDHMREYLGLRDKNAF